MTSPGNRPGHSILIYQSHFKVMTRVFIISDAFISKTVQRGVALIIWLGINSSIIAWTYLYFRPICLPRSGEASLVSGSEYPTSLFGTLTTRTLLSRQQVSTTTYRQPTTLTWILSRLRRVKDPSRYYPQIVTRNRWPISLHTQPN